MQQNVKRISLPTRWTRLSLRLTCLFASRWCCSLFTHNHRETWQHMLSCSPTDMCSTLLKGEKKKSRLVPELGQMFEINGNFLVFFELGQMRGKKGKSLSFFIGWAWGVLQLPLLVLLRLFPLTEQKQTLFSIVVFSYSCWEGVGGLSVGILLLWNMVGQDAWAKYLYKHGQQEEVTSQHLHLEVEPQWAVCTPSPLLCMWYCFFLSDVIHHIFDTVSFHFKLPVTCWHVIYCLVSQQWVCKLLKRGALLLTLLVNGKRVKQMTAYSGWQGLGAAWEEMEWESAVRQTAHSPWQMGEASAKGIPDSPRWAVCTCPSPMCTDATISLSNQ